MGRGWSFGFLWTSENHLWKSHFYLCQSVTKLGHRTTREYPCHPPGTPPPDRALSIRVAIPRQALADAAKRFDWAGVFEILADNRVSVNAWRLDGRSFFTPLHQAAFGNAPVDVVSRLIGLGAWRTLPTSSGERAVDIAERRGHRQLVFLLEPDYKHLVPVEQLAAIQTHFHAMIRERAGELVDRHTLRLPELAVLLELEDPYMAFPVVGMYGGFYFQLEGQGANAKLMVESWSRVVMGSGQRHGITEFGCVLVEEGFV